MIIILLNNESAFIEEYEIIISSYMFCDISDTVSQKKKNESNWSYRCHLNRLFFRYRLNIFTNC